MWLAVFLCAFIFGLLLLLDAKKPTNFPPGPKWYPFVGSALCVAKMRQNMGGYLYKATAELARQYGPIVGLKVGKDRQVICCDYPTIKEMLTMEEFDGRPQGPFYETRTWGTRRGLLLTDEEFWVEQRRFVLRHLREFGFGRRTMAELVETEAEHLLSVFKENVNKGNGKAIVEMADAFGVNVLNTLWMMMASIRYSPDDKELKKLQNLLTELFANIDMVGTLFSQFPVLRHIAPEISGYKQFIDIHQRVWTFLKTELDNHKKTFCKGEPRDLMDVYLEMLNSEDRKPSFSESQLLAICMDMFMAGSETTSKSLGFGFLYMVLTPEVQRKAQEEIDRTVGRDRLPTLQDRPNMPYIEAIVYESVRVFMGRTFSIPHRALKDTVLNGYNIPKDTMIIANFNGTLMDKTLWGDPENFRPDRFLDESGKIHVPDYYLPFGFGKHRCMGQTLARSNIFLFTATLLQHFNFEIPPGQEPPDTKGIDGVTPSPGPYYALVTPRT
ncbi:probable cytochrome P450 303a1 [Cimex lectularius]|uniref:Cytochrome P450 n=1 Tax=Cimex lectularius TaxID=79782 RepID=A0A8I6SFQ7_CIMLE|nr:probable cytochrome P450 303a1 [Cimex lectularius]XP_024080569.1 probable cytochrome P450 303a1 [Cimex lectularius]XP_024080570.1 probable cytochrome P450 303a1 [Cimex lectularius]